MSILESPAYSASRHGSTGANDYLTKPLSKAELFARVWTHRELLDVHRNLERRVAERNEEAFRANAQLARMASLDGLPRIANRRSFDEFLALGFIL